MTPYIVYQSPNGYSVLNTEHIYCHNVTRVAAIAAIVVEFGEVDESAFETLADFGTYKSTLQSATQSTLAFCEASIEQRSESETTDKLRALLTLTLSAVTELTEAIERENQIQADTLAFAKAEATRIKAEQAAKQQAEAERRETMQRKQAEQQAEADKRLDRKASKNLDGSVEVTESKSEYIGGQYRTIRKVVARYKSVELARAAGVNV